MTVRLAVTGWAEPNDRVGARPDRSPMHSCGVTTVSPVEPYDFADRNHLVSRKVIGAPRREIVRHRAQPPTVMGGVPFHVERREMRADHSGSARTESVLSPSREATTVIGVSGCSDDALSGKAE